MHIVFAIPVLGLSVYAWMMWMYEGSVRQWSAALLFPKSWRGDRTRKEIAGMSAVSFDEWLCLEASCSSLLRKLLICPFCMSFHISFWLSVLFLICARSPVSYPMFPFLVFTGAGVGMYLFKTKK